MYVVFVCYACMNIMYARVVMYASMLCMYVRYARMRAMYIRCESIQVELCCML